MKDALIFIIGAGVIYLVVKQYKSSCSCGCGGTCTEKKIADKVSSTASAAVTAIKKAVQGDNPPPATTVSNGPAMNFAGVNDTWFADYYVDKYPISPQSVFKL